MTDIEVKNIVAKFMRWGFVASPGELTLSDTHLIFEHAKIRIPINEISQCRYKKIMGIMDGIEVKTSKRKIIFALNFSDEKEWIDFLSILNPGKLPPEVISLEEKRRLDHWLQELEKRKNGILNFLVAYLLIAPGFSILWGFIKMFLTKQEWFPFVNLLLSLLGILWVVDLVSLMVRFLVMIFRGPFPICVKIYGFLVILVGNFLIIPFLYFHGFGTLAKREISQ